MKNEFFALFHSMNNRLTVGIATYFSAHNLSLLTTIIALSLSVLLHLFFSILLHFVTLCVINVFYAVRKTGVLLVYSNRIFCTENLTESANPRSIFISFYNMFLSISLWASRICKRTKIKSIISMWLFTTPPPKLQKLPAYSSDMTDDGPFPARTRFDMPHFEWMMDCICASW